MSAHPLGWEKIISRSPVYIPAANGRNTAKTIWVDVTAWKDPKTGEVYLDGEEIEKLESVKARYIGIMKPAQIRELRDTLGFTQKAMSDLLQLGEKSWTRWESGRERPSRSMNILLSALYDGHLSVNYLKSLGNPELSSKIDIWKPYVRYDVSDCDHERKPERWKNESSPLAA